MHSFFVLCQCDLADVFAWLSCFSSVLKVRYLLGKNTFRYTLSLCPCLFVTTPCLPVIGTPDFFRGLREADWGRSEAVGQVVQASRREQDEQASKQHTSVASASVPASRFLPLFKFLPWCPSMDVTQAMQAKSTQAAVGQGVLSQH